MAQEHIVNLTGFKFSNRDMVDFKRVTGKSMTEAMTGEAGERMKTDPDFEVLAAFSWVVIRKTTPGFTYDDALDADIDDASFVEALQAILPTPPVATAGKRQTKSKS